MSLELETPRLRLRPLRLDDAPFILELLNDPDWLRFIGDKQVRNLDDARGYLENGPLAMYVREGFGLLAVERKDDSKPLGMCGLLRRPGLDHPDLGFAFLPAARGAGFVTEAANAVLADARTTLRLPRVLAITSLDNAASIRVLERVGLRFERLIALDPAREQVRLFAIDLAIG